MKFWLLSLILFSCCYAEAKKCDKPLVRIAVLDTGFGYQNKGHEAKLCKEGHRDFSIEGLTSYNYNTLDPIPLDFNGHGTNVAGIIDEYASKAHVNYCIVVLKYYSDNQSGWANLLATVAAINYANVLGVDFINYSAGGAITNYEEGVAVKEFINRGGKFVAAAGNDHLDLDRPGNSYYPAMEDKRVIVVGSNNIYGVRSKYSNYGSVVKRWELGESVEAYGITLTGTSQATAVATGRMVSEIRNKCDR